MAKQITKKQIDMLSGMIDVLGGWFDYGMEGKKDLKKYTIGQASRLITNNHDEYYSIVKDGRCHYSQYKELEEIAKKRKKKMKKSKYEISFTDAVEWIRRYK